MDEKNQPFSEDFEKFFQRDMGVLEEGGIVKGRVVKIAGDSVIVDIGYKAEGVVPLKEFLDSSGKPAVEEGSEISVLLVKREDESGYVVLSKARADQLMVWDELLEASKKNTNISGTVARKVSGGFRVDIKGVEAFLPASLADMKPLRDPSSLIGNTFDFKVIKYIPRKHNIVLSRRAVLEEDREGKRKETLEKLAEGAIVEGTVKNITDYGAFIDLGGIDGLLHSCDISWGKVGHPSSALKVGDRIRVMVIKYDREKGRISLGLKQTRPNPWETVKERYPVGARVAGRVANLSDYGAFVVLEEGLEGLIHISEISWTKIRHPSQKLKTGQTVEVVVLGVDIENRRISLGLKQTEPNPWDEISEKYPKGSTVKGRIKNITDFGVFIGVEEGIDGLVHISDISWKKIKHPSEVFAKGEEVEAVVLTVDKESRKFCLSTKLLEKNPWADAGERYKPGMIVEGRVTGEADFGAFVELEEGVEGLVHISELNRARKRGAEVKKGDRVDVEVLNVNTDEKKIGLGLRNVLKEDTGEVE